MKNLFSKFIQSQNIVSDANKTMSIQPVKQQFLKVYVGSKILRYFTIAVAIFASYRFLYDFFYKLFEATIFDSEALITIFSFIAVGLIELAGTFFLAVTFKFIIRGRWDTSVATLIGALIFYGASFYTSTNGLALRQTELRDNTKTIVDNSALIKSETDKKFQNLYTEIDTRIQRIEANPQGWSNHKRSYLTDEQLNEISRLQSQKDTLRNECEKSVLNIENERKLALKVNTKTVHSEAEKYHSRMALIMALNFIATFIYIFILHRVRLQESKDSVMSEDLSEISEIVEINASHAAMNGYQRGIRRVNESLSFQQDYETRHDKAIAAKLREYFDEMKKSGKTEHEYSLQELEEKIENDIETERKQSRNRPVISPETEKKQPIHVGGFNSENKAAKTMQVVSRPNSYDEKTLDFLRKHKPIVKAILGLNPQPENSISNAQIRQVTAIAKRHRYLGRTTIQKVFEATKTAEQTELEKIIR